MSRHPALSPPLPALLAVLVAGLALPAAARTDVSTRTANDGNVRLEEVPPIPEALVDTLNRYQNVREASVQDWTADGSALLVTTRFGDTRQVHRVDAPLGMRRQLTFFDEPVGGVERRPGREQFLFAMDAGGSEFYQLFLFDPASGASRRLTDGSSRNGAPVFSRDGEWLAYQSTRRDGRSNDVWIMDPDQPGEARLAFEAPDGSWYGPADFSPDGTRLLVMQYISVSDSRIHLLDLTTGDAQLVAGGGLAPGSYLGITPTFTADGSAFWLATDQDAEFRQLAIQDVTTGERTLLSEEIPWDVESFERSRDGLRAAVSFNVEGRSALYLLETSTNLLEPLELLPPGLVRGLAFAPDGRRLALSFESATSPSDAWVLTLGEEPRLQRWTASEVGGLDTSRFLGPELVRYPTFDEVDGEPRRIPAWVYRPRGKGPHPVVISIHGGPEGQARPTFSSTYQLWLNELGVAVIAPNVRGSTGYGKTYSELDNAMLREDSVRDIGALLDWIADQPDLDAERVAVYGGSYGGYMVLASAVHYGEQLAAAVDLVGISNFVTFLENTQDYRRDLRRPEYGDERDPEMRAFLESISPANQADRIHVPLFVAQGLNDPRVPASEAEQIVAAVRENDREVWAFYAENEGHGFRKKENRDLFTQATVLFFEQHLLPKQPDG